MIGWTEDQRIVDKGRSVGVLFGKMVAPTEKEMPMMLENEDEFEDFPTDSALKTDGFVDGQKKWEDSWEEDDDAEDFAVQLK